MSLYVNIPAVASGGAGSMSTALTRAQTILGASNITKVMGSDFDNDQWYRTILSSGTVTPSTTKAGGVITLSTTASSGRNAYIQPHGTINLIDSPAGSRWYWTCRFAVTSAIDANASCAMRLCTASIQGAPQIGLGAEGSISTSFFSYFIQNDASAVTQSGATTVAIDTSMHVWEIWNDTTNISFAIDGVTLITKASTNAGSNSCAPAVEVTNGATAAARTLDLDYLWFCTGNPS